MTDTATSTQAPVRQTVSPAKLGPANVGDRIEFTQDNGWRGGIDTVAGVITAASQYRPMFSLARVTVDGELYAVRYDTPVTILRAPGRPPMLGADYQAPKTARPGAKRDPIPVVQQQMTAAQLTSRHLGWTITDPIVGSIEDLRKNGATVVVTVDSVEHVIPAHSPVVIARMTAADPEDQL